MYTFKTANLLFILIVLTVSAVLNSCKTMPGEKPIFDEYEEYLTPDPDAEELFRVLIISDRYAVSQMRYDDKLSRLDDSEEDQYICNKLKEYDKIDEVAEGILTVWLYPKSGKLMKIRPKVLAPIAEVNSLIVEDLKRWKFEFMNDEVDPNMFDIRYKVVLRKMQSDDEIMKEVMEKVQEEEAKKKRRSEADDD